MVELLHFDTSSFVRQEQCKQKHQTFVTVNDAVPNHARLTMFQHWLILNKDIIINSKPISSHCPYLDIIINMLGILERKVFHSPEHWILNIPNCQNCQVQAAEYSNDEINLTV